MANSEFTAEVARQEGFGPVVVVPLGARLPELIAGEQGVPRYVFFVGRLVRRKGAAWFAEHVLPHLPADLEMYVVGRTWDKDEERALAAAARVRRFGYVPDDELNRMRRNAVAQIMPNIPDPDGASPEGFGIAAVEAAASGSPLLAADLEGLRDAVRHRDTGILLPPADADAWVGAVQEVLHWSAAERSQFVADARQSVAVHYSWQRVAEDTIAAYRASVDARARNP